MKPSGNAKTQHGGVGIISCLSNGCFRKLTGCGRCSERCYQDDGKCQSGCYADLTAHAMIRWNTGFSVIHNGYEPGTEGFFHVRLPKNGDYDLSRYATRIFRVDSESSTSCMSLSLGLTQRWAEANPRSMFTGISSDYFRVSDYMLERAAQCGNIVIGHSLSPWFAEDDLRNRIREAHRWQDAGVTTMIWVATRPEWNDAYPETWDLVRQELGSWNPEQVVEVPYHDRYGHAVHTLKVNPFGGCCEVGVDPCGNYARMDSGYEGKLFGSCRGCRVMCGVRWLHKQRAGRS